MDTTLVVNATQEEVTCAYSTMMDTCTGSSNGNSQYGCSRDFKRECAFCVTKRQLEVTRDELTEKVQIRDEEAAIPSGG